MIDINRMFKTGLGAMTNHAPALLTAFGAVGVVGTAVLTGKATFEAAKRIQEAQEERALELTGEADAPFQLTKQEKIKLVWPLYISAVSSGVLSCGAIVLSHRISSRRAAVLAAAYALNESKLEEYQDKIKEKFGVKKEKEARDEMAQSRVNSDYDANEVIVTPFDGKTLMREDYTGRFFYGTREGVNQAVNEINARIIGHEGSARISDFYDLIGLSHVSTSDYFGWTANERLELEWSTCTTPDGTEAVHSFEYVNHPVMNPEREAGFR